MFSSPKTWTAARDDCIARGGALASPITKQEQAEVADLLAGMPSSTDPAYSNSTLAWIGLGGAGAYTFGGWSWSFPHADETHTKNGPTIPVLGATFKHASAASSADLCIDGLATTHCQSQTPGVAGDNWLRLDLGSTPVNVSYVQIWNGGVDGSGLYLDQLGAHEIIVGNHEDSPLHTSHVRCVHSWSSAWTIDEPCAAQGKHLWIYLSQPSSVIALREVKVFGQMAPNCWNSNGLLRGASDPSTRDCIATASVGIDGRSNSSVQDQCVSGDHGFEWHPMACSLHLPYLCNVALPPSPPPSPPPPSPPPPGQPPPKPSSPPSPLSPPSPPPSPPPTQQADCAGFPIVSGYLRICLSYTAFFNGVSQHLRILGYVKDRYDYESNPSRKRKLYADLYPISMHFPASSTSVSDEVSTNMPLEMAKRGYCAVSVQYADSLTSQYCAGQFDLKAAPIVASSSSNAASALSVLEREIPFCSSSRGFALSGSEQGGHIALLARQHNPLVSAILLFRSGVVNKDKTTEITACAEEMQPKLKYTGHYTYSPKTMVRALMGESDGVFSPSKQQMSELTGVSNAECATSGASERNCLNAVGYGYYLISAAENGGYDGHDFLHAGASLSAGWTSGTGPGSRLANLNWLATTASNAPTVQTLA